MCAIMQRTHAHDWVREIVLSWEVVILLALPFVVCLVFAIDQIFFDAHRTGIDEDQ